MTQSNQHVALLGDSIFDNASYTQGGLDVVAQLRSVLPAGRATLLAVDGAVCDDVHSQLSRVPADATHLFLSAGGNDAIMASSLLMQPVSVVGEGFYVVAEAANAFEMRHTRLLDACAAKKLPLVVGTIYNPRFSDPLNQAVSVAALCLFNDAIIRNAANRGLPILDLRRICTEFGDYANDIEPSSQGALKIARTIHQILEAHDFSQPRPTIYPLP
ncbi:MAG TPA: SGNH/GDSL hydrolase family protein [Abditibacterium sp.]|jgi:lysophospholipase L1-like esterase